MKFKVIEHITLKLTSNALVIAVLLVIAELNSQSQFNIQHHHHHYNQHATTITTTSDLCLTGHWPIIQSYSRQVKMDHSIAPPNAFPSTSRKVPRSSTKEQNKQIFAKF